jgi:hypothetical protein
MKRINYITVLDFEVGEKKQGTEVWELPFKTMYYSGYAEPNRFSVYKSGYVRKMVVHPKSNASYSCYQLNKQRKSDEYFKDYDCNGSWTGKYRKSNRTERIMIDTHRDRIVYLCNYILKNYYKSGKMNLVGEYTMKRVAEVHGEWWKANRNSYDLPFEETVERDSWIDDNDVKVIINGHRYNLS